MGSRVIQANEGKGPPGKARLKRRADRMPEKRDWNAFLIITKFEMRKITGYFSIFQPLSH